MSVRAKQKINVHPGEVLQDMLDELGMTQSQLARHLETDHAKINVICKGKRGVSADMAARLGRAFKTGPDFWLELQKNWELSNLDEADYKSISALKNLAA